MKNCNQILMRFRHHGAIVNEIKQHMENKDIIDTLFFVLEE